MKDVIYRIMSWKDQWHVDNINGIESPFTEDVATILGGGIVSLDGLVLLKKRGVDLALNYSKLEGVEIRNIVYELPRKNYKLMMNHLQEFKKAGSKIHYRPSARDSKIHLIQEFININDQNLRERRISFNKKNLIQIVKNKNINYVPYYRCSIFMAIMWAVISGCKKIDLYGINLSHDFMFNPEKKMHGTLRLIKDENAYTLMYKTWRYLMEMGIEIRVDQFGVMREIFGRVE